ncbi:MAG: hypothetical protein AAGH57_12975 [Pseudomonadota bacterium]
MSVSADELATIGIFGLGGGPVLPGTTDVFGGDNGGGGGQLPSDDNEDQIPINEDTEAQELAEDIVEAFLEDEVPGSTWVVEFDEDTNVYRAASTDGATLSFTQEVVDIIISASN